VKKFVMIFLIALAALGLAALAFSSSATPPAGKITISVSGAKPATFDHAAHVGRAGGDCQKCHHKDPKGQGSKCTACHTATGKDGATPGKEMFHKKCGDCHKTMAKGPQYPKDCKVCHGG
jgi:hypothetical protein